MTAGTLTPTDVVLANATATDPNRLCLNPAPAGTYTGKVVICRRGTNGRVDKGYNVLQGGAAGMILYNTANQDLDSDSHWLSAIHINGPSTGSTGNSAKVLAFLAANTGVKATWANGTATLVRGDVMLRALERFEHHAALDRHALAARANVLADLHYRNSLATTCTLQ